MIPLFTNIAITSRLIAETFYISPFLDSQTYDSFCKNLLYSFYLLTTVDVTGKEENRKAKRLNSYHIKLFPICMLLPSI